MFFKQIAISEELNNKWRILYESKAFTLKKIKLNTNPKFFCIGSCFAEYVKNSLENQTGTHCYPDYRSMPINGSYEIADTINIGKYHMNHYSVGSILQEFKRALGKSDKSSFPPIEIKGLDIFEGQKAKNEKTTIFQDPYRREVFAKTHPQITNLSQRINETVKSGIFDSNVFIITLGLVELWVDSKSGNIFNQYPGYMGAGYTCDTLKFRRATYSELVDQLSELILIITDINPQNAVIISVSPVPLQLTFTEDDIFQANLYSKSLLRAAVEEVRELFPQIHYFPSYEIAMNMGSAFFQERDLRHAKPAYVDQIMKVFLQAIKPQD